MVVENRKNVNVYVASQEVCTMDMIATAWSQQVEILFLAGGLCIARAVVNDLQPTFVSLQQPLFAAFQTPFQLITIFGCDLSIST